MAPPEGDAVWDAEPNEERMSFYGLEKQRDTSVGQIRRNLACLGVWMVGSNTEAPAAAQMR